MNVESKGRERTYYEAKNNDQDVRNSSKLPKYIKNLRRCSLTCLLHRAQVDLKLDDSFFIIVKFLKIILLSLCLDLFLDQLESRLVALVLIGLFVV